MLALTGFRVLQTGVNSCTVWWYFFPFDVTVTSAAAAAAAAAGKMTHPPSRGAICRKAPHSEGGCYPVSNFSKPPLQLLQNN